jgi:membrane-associated phospholipid phosphatase
MHALSIHRTALGWAVLCAAACAALAVIVASVVAVTAWDAGVVRALNPVVAGNPALRIAATVATTVGSPVSVDVLTVVAIVIAWLRCAAKVERVWAAVYLAVARLVELGLATATKTLVDRPRPTVPHPLAVATDASFPSGHTAGTAVLCISALLLLHAAGPRPLRVRPIAVATVVIASVAASRVLLGVHYPTDVLGGALLGTATALALVPLLAVGVRRAPTSTRRADR